MEIKRFMNSYKKHSIKFFYNWASQDKVMEIRFLSDYLGNKFSNWQLIKNLADELKCEYRFSSVYINSYAQLEKLLLRKISGKYPLVRFYNVFMRMNPCRKVNIKGKNGLIYKSYYGGIAGCSHLQNAGCDIEHIGQREGNATEEMLQECIQGAEHLIKILELDDYYINCSGNGVHLWFRFFPTIELPMPSFFEFKDKLKYNLKEEPINSFIKRYNRFIEKINKILKEYNPNLKVDEGAKDLSRILRIPGSWNVKVGKQQRAVGTIKTSCITDVKYNSINKYINKKFFAVKPLLNKSNKKAQERHFQNNQHRYNPLNLRESPLYKLLTSKLLPSTLSRNHYLEQSFALILKENEIELYDVDDIVEEINQVQQKNIQVDPEYLDDELFFNSEMINNYCITCGIDLVYPLLEEIPNIVEGFIDEEKAINWNNYSMKTLKIMMVQIEFKTYNYFQLKTVIRELIDADYSRLQIFLACKNLCLDEWAYYWKNKIIIQLLNKTRKSI